MTSVFAQWVGGHFRADGRAEIRHESGTPVRGPQVPVDRTQVVLALAAEALLRDDLTVSGRLNFSRTVGLEGLEARLVEGHWAPPGGPGRCCSWLATG